MIRICTKEIVRNAGQTRREAELQAVSHCLLDLGVSEEIGHDRSGAPFLERNPEIRISISHSAQIAAVAVGSPSDGLFGIDVETASRQQLLKVVPRITSEKELLYAKSMEEGYAKVWTAKEAVYKAVSLPSVDFCRDIEIVTSDLKEARCVRETKMFKLSYISLPKDNVLCVASEGNNFELITL